MVGYCKCCGQCCSAFYVDMSREELLERATKEKALGLTRLESDAIFVIDHCIPLSPEEACQRSPLIAESPHWPQKSYWTCKYLRDKRFCQLDLDGLDKPNVCKGYPWYGKSPQEEKWLYPGCGFKIKEGEWFMARIKITDLPSDALISREEMKKVFGGIIAKNLINSGDILWGSVGGTGIINERAVVDGAGEEDNIYSQQSTSLYKF